MKKINQIKCPYCRHICNNLLPYRELDHVEKLYGINYPEKYIMPDYKCIWKFKAGPKKNTLCQLECLEIVNFFKLVINSTLKLRNSIKSNDYIYTY